MLPLTVVRRLFWFAAMINPPTARTSRPRSSCGWLGMLRVCRAWNYAALTDPVFVAETYTHRPFHTASAAMMSEYQPLHYDTAVGNLQNMEPNVPSPLRCLFENTDFNRIGRLKLHAGAGIREHVIRLSEISVRRPLLHLTSLIVECDTTFSSITMAKGDGSRYVTT